MIFNAPLEKELIYVLLPPNTSNYENINSSHFSNNGLYNIRNIIINDNTLIISQFRENKFTNSCVKNILKKDNSSILVQKIDILYYGIIDYELYKINNSSLSNSNKFIYGVLVEGVQKNVGEIFFSPEQIVETDLEKYIQSETLTNNTKISIPLLKTTITFKKPICLDKDTYVKVNYLEYTFKNSTTSCLSSTCASKSNDFLLNIILNNKTHLKYYKDDSTNYELIESKSITYNNNQDIFKNMNKLFKCFLII